MSKKLMINHFVDDPKFSNGVTNYIKEVNHQVTEKYEVLYKPYKMNMPEFRTYIYNKLGSNPGKFDIIECAESQSPCLYLPNNFNIHVRMHCPFYLFKKIIHEEPSESRFSDEVRAMYKAKAISSPSHGMLDLLNTELDIDKIHVYKNPMTKRLDYYKKHDKKEIDVLFFGRFNKLKGNEYLVSLISLLPKEYKIVIAGKQEHKIILPDNKSTNVEVLDHIEGDDKFQLLSNAKTVVSLSKFENCSMAILESFSVGTPVVAWDVGGNSEIAPPSIIKLAQIGDINEISRLIIKQVESTGIEKKEYNRVLDLINNDFIQGSKHVEDFIKKETLEVYKGISFKEEHNKIITEPTIIKGENQEEYVGIPLNVLLVTSTLASARFFHKVYSNKLYGINCKIAYQGPYYSQIQDICDYNIEQRLDNINNLTKLIEKEKFNNIIVDKSFPLFINDLYRISHNKKSLNIIYSDRSLINKNNYTLDEMGHGNLSKLAITRIKSKENTISIPYGKVLIRGENLNIKHTEILSVLKKIYKNDTDTVIDFASSNNMLLLELTQSSSYAYNLVNEDCINESEYSIVISIDDIGLINYFDYKNAIFIVNIESIFKNKNIDNNKFVQNSLLVDIGSREVVKEYIMSKDLTNNPNLIRNLYA